MWISMLFATTLKLIFYKMKTTIKARCFKFQPHYKLKAFISWDTAKKSCFMSSMQRIHNPVKQASMSQTIILQQKPLSLHHVVLFPLESCKMSMQNAPKIIFITQYRKRKISPFYLQIVLLLSDHFNCGECGRTLK